MIRVKNHINFWSWESYIPTKLLGKISLSLTCEITEHEKQLLKQALSVLQEQFEYENRQNIARVSLIFSENGNVSLEYVDDKQIGSQISLCIYAVKRWQEYNDKGILAIILEELCHHFWAIEDEILVQYKVIEIMKRIYPSIERSNIYDINWKQN
jgi:hypothetical protein